MAINDAIFNYGSTLSYVCDLMKKHSEEDIDNAVSALISSAGKFDLFFGIIGIPPFAALITLGSVVTTGMSFAVLTFGATLSYVCDLMKKHSEDEVDAAMSNIMSAAEKFSLLFGIIGIPPIALLVSMGSSTVLGMGVALTDFGKALDIVGDVYKKYGDSLEGALEFTQNALDGIESLFKGLAFSFT